MSIILDDIRLPENWSKGSAGGPTWLTDQVPTADGDHWNEQRWEDPLHRFDIAHNIKTPAAIGQLRAFFNGRRGAHRGFLLKDWLDWTSNADGDAPPTMLDQPLGTGTGALTTFQLVKRYADTVNPYDREIKWPVTGTLLVAVNGVLKVSGVAVVRGTGVVTLTPAPAAAAVITAGFEFDVPVKFQDDFLSVSFDTINSRSAGSVPIEEVRRWLA